MVLFQYTFSKIVQIVRNLCMNWKTWTVSLSDESLNPTSNSAGLKTVGSLCICEISMDFHTIVSKFHMCKHIYTNENAQLRNPSFSGTVNDIIF